MRIDLDHQEDREFVAKMVELKCRIPNISEVCIQSMNDKCDSLPQFLLHCVPHSKKDLLFNIYPSDYYFDCDSYCPGLEEAVKGVDRQAYLRKSIISGSNVEAIVKASSKAKVIFFDSCKIDSSEKLDFDGPEYR